MLREINRRTSRAALLPTPGDPFLFAFWFKMFKNAWYREVDKLYVCLNTPAEPDAIQYIKDIIGGNDKVSLTYYPYQIEHGAALDSLLTQVKEKYVMIIEDDGLIFRPGAVDQCFNIIENGGYKIVGSKRGSCSQEILDGAKDKWGLNYDGLGDQGPNFWPNFFFVEADTLRATSRNFGARAWQKGEIIEPLGIDAQNDCASDTFVQASLELRNIVPQEQIAYIPQYHLHPLDLEHYEARTDIFDGKAPWLHIGSLSSGFGGILQDNYSRPLSRRLIDGPGDTPTKLRNTPQNDFEKQEWERRVQWWLMFYWHSPAIGLAELKRLYLEAIERVILYYDLKRPRIEQRIKIFERLLGF